MLTLPTQKNKKQNMDSDWPTLHFEQPSLEGRFHPFRAKREGEQQQAVKDRKRLPVAGSESTPEKGAGRVSCFHGEVAEVAGSMFCQRGTEVKRKLPRRLPRVLLKPLPCERGTLYSDFA